MTLWAAATGSPPLAPDDATARRWLREELGKAPYHPHENPVDWVVRHVTDLFDKVAHAGGPGGVPLWGTVVVLAAVVVGIVIVVGPLRARRPATDRPAAVLPDEETTAEQWRAEAVRAQRDQDWSRALVAAYRATVRAAVDRVLVEPWPGLTAHEAAAAIGTRLPSLADQAHQVADTFDTVCYGHGAASAEQAVGALALADAVQHERAVAASAASAGATA